MNQMLMCVNVRAIACACVCVLTKMQWRPAHPGLLDGALHFPSQLLQPPPPLPCAHPALYAPIFHEKGRALNLHFIFVRVMQSAGQSDCGGQTALDAVIKEEEGKGSLPRTAGYTYLYICACTCGCVCVCACTHMCKVLDVLFYFLRFSVLFSVCLFCIL